MERQLGARIVALSVVICAGSLAGANSVITAHPQQSGAITIRANSRVTVQVPMMEVTAAMSTFSGVVKCDTLITNSVVSPSYTPGAGNIW